MKKSNFFSMLAVAFALMTGVTSCSNDEDVTGGGVEGLKAKLNISVTAPTMTKAVGTAAATDNIDNFCVFITDQTNEIAWSAYSATGANLTGANAVPTSNQAKHVYIIANSGNLTATGTGDITDMSELNAFLADLNGAADINGRQDAFRWATGTTAGTTPTPLNFVQQPSGDFEATTSIALTFIAARITLTIQDGMTGYNPAAVDGSLVLKEVAVMNARGESKLFGTSLIPLSYTANKMYYTGIADNSFANYPAAADFTDLSAGSLFRDPIAANDWTSVYSYYVFENDAAVAADFPTIITLIAEFDGKTIYYPVHIAAYEQWTTGSNPSNLDFIKRGHSYDINVKLTVDPTIGGGNPGGTVDPTDPVVNAKVNISVSLTPWVPVVLGKEF